MKVARPKLLLHALLACAVSMAACTNPGYNDNPSQQMTNARVGCLAATEFFAVYFNVHVQPSSEYQDAMMTEALFRPYCEDIPTPGNVFLTVDLVGNELRKTPVGVRVVEEDSGEDASQTENGRDLRSLLEIPPKIYEKGFIEANFQLDKKGYYAIYLFKGGQDAISEEGTLRIALNVGVGLGGKLLTQRILPLFGVASVLALITYAAFRNLRRR